MPLPPPPMAYPPAPPIPAEPSPLAQQIAAATGLEAADVDAGLRQQVEAVAMQYAAPLLSATLGPVAHQYAAAHPHEWAVTGTRVQDVLSTVPANVLLEDPKKAFDMAASMARGFHYDELRAIDQQPPGKVVGRFVNPGRFMESAQPSSVEGGPTDAGLDNSAMGLLNSMVTDQGERKRILDRVHQMRAQGHGIKGDR